MIKRLSSTSLSSYERCKRRFAFGHVLEEENPSSEPMDIGSIFHACVEYKLKTRRRPAPQNIAWMNANYESYDEIMTRSPGAFKVARQMLDYEEFDPFDYVDPSEGGVELEYDTAVLGLTVPWTMGDGHTTLEGYIDVLDHNRHKILDWKTRGRFDYAPQSFEDFSKNVQLTYYGALVAKGLGWPTVTIGHINVLRPGGKGPKVLYVEQTFDAKYMLDVYEHVERVVLPEMEYVCHQLEDNVALVEANWAHCWQFGKCPFMGQCPSLMENSGDDFLAMGALMEL